MILKNNFYTIEQKKVDGEKVSYQLRLHKEHAIYQAHFPNMPVTPGVCIVQIAKELLEDFMGLNLRIQRIKNIKFLSVISPEENPVIIYHFDKVSNLDNNIQKVLITVLSNEERMAKLSFESARK